MGILMTSIYLNYNYLIFFKILANTAPEILCHTEKIAPGTVAIERSGNADPAKDVARPEFCIPISIDKAFFFATGRFSSFPSKYPQAYPDKLWIITTRKTIKPVDSIFSEL